VLLAKSGGSLIVTTWGEGALGLQGVEARMLLKTLQCPDRLEAGRPQGRENWPGVNSVEAEKCHCIITYFISCWLILLVFEDIIKNIKVSQEEIINHSSWSECLHNVSEANAGCLPYFEEMRSRSCLHAHFS
jgi:hypothetical protein